MRPLLFVLGLAFTAIVLIAYVDAIWCFEGKGDDQEFWRLANPCSENATLCVKKKVNGENVRFCGTPADCNDTADGTFCCNQDSSNGVVESCENATIQCYDGRGDVQNCWVRITCPPGTTQCVTFKDKGEDVRLCGIPAHCHNPANGTVCCNGTLCNGGMNSTGVATSIQPVSLVIAVISSTIAAYGV